MILDAEPIEETTPARVYLLAALRAVCPGLREFFVLVGVSFVTYGLWQPFGPAALVAPGALFVYLGLWHGNARPPAPPSTTGRA